MHRSPLYWLSLGAVSFFHISVAQNNPVVERQSGPVPPDTIKDCTFYYDSQPGDTCDSIAANWGISTQDFVRYNPSTKSDCSGLVIGTSYCVEENNGNGPVITTTSGATTPVTTTAPSPTAPSPVQSGINAQSPTGPSVPSPHQDGIIASCTKYYKVVSGDTCQKIVDKFGTFTIDQFAKWNPAVGGADCPGLWLGYQYCIEVPGETKPAATTSKTVPSSPSGPTPTQSGIISSCTKYYKVVSGDTCQGISDKFGTFSVADFGKWNPAVGGADCSGLWLG
ncbi:MAG: hypothetical protein Q9218_002635 [Villophora microphyllina]